VVTGPALHYSPATRSQLWCANSVFPFVGLFMVGWVLVGQLLPPLAPSLGAREVQAFFAEHRTRLRICMVISMYSTAFLIPFSAAIIGQIARIERSEPRVWTYSAVIAAAGNVVSFTFPLMFWTVALFRADRPADLVLLASDLAWLPFLGMISPYVVLPVCVAMAGLLDDSPNPAFPRWYCYFTLATAIAILPAALIVFFQQGWFAWNSLFGWWLPFSDVFGWTILTWYLVRRAIIAQAGLAQAGLAQAGAGTPT
jgi:hypothetical protein